MRSHEPVLVEMSGAKMTAAFIDPERALAAAKCASRINVMTGSIFCPAERTRTAPPLSGELRLRHTIDIAAVPHCSNI